MKKKILFNVLITTSIIGVSTMYHSYSANAYDFNESEKEEVNTFSLGSISFDEYSTKMSNELKVDYNSQKETISYNFNGYREFKLGTKTHPQIYTKKELLVYNGEIYETLITHSNYGDVNWAPDIANNLFKKINNTVTEFKPELPKQHLGLVRFKNDSKYITFQFNRSAYNREDYFSANVYRDGVLIGELVVDKLGADYYDVNDSKVASMTTAIPRIRDKNVVPNHEYSYYVVFKDNTGKEIIKSEEFKQKL
ncbi:TPA: hypothetical protein OTT57_002014 [Enterococcus faecalis]|nr:hypothetical protein [Enterococcus faecalis]